MNTCLAPHLARDESQKTYCYIVVYICDSEWVSVALHRVNIHQSDLICKL